MKENKSIVNQVYTKLLMQFIVCFCLYIQVFGEISPGGGFQAGAIFISGLIAYDLSCKEITEYITPQIMLKTGVIGMLIYGGTGVFGFIYERNFLDYSILAPVDPRILGIILVEIGIAITVASSFGLIYLELKNAD